MTNHADTRSTRVACEYQPGKTHRDGGSDYQNAINAVVDHRRDEIQTFTLAYGKAIEAIRAAAMAEARERIAAAETALEAAGVVIATCGAIIGAGEGDIPDALWEPFVAASRASDAAITKYNSWRWAGDGNEGPDA